jgi:hypothetical protein
MAGDWIKMRADLFTHPKVVRMASALKADTLRTVGGLMSAWCLFDAHSDDGRLEGYSPEVLDAHLRWDGFAAAMIAVGWLEHDQAHGLALPRFDTHNGQSAKRRAQDADRKREVRKASASDADKLRTREEKRRDTSTTDVVDDKRAARTRPAVRPEGVSESVWADFLTVRKAKRAPLTQTALDGIQREAAKAGMGLHDALALCCARGWQGFKADWVAGQKRGVVMPQSKAARQAADQAWVDELMERRPAGSLIDITDAQIVGESA